jgi:hypothetical protein
LAAACHVVQILIQQKRNLQKGFDSLLLGEKAIADKGYNDKIILSYSFQQNSSKNIQQEAQKIMARHENHKIRGL